MKIRKLLGKYEYLFRIALSLFLLFFVVAGIFYFTLFKDSYRKIVDNYYSSYRNTNLSSAIYFNEMLDMLKNKASAIAIQNENNLNNRIDKEMLEINPYYLYNAVTALNNYKAVLSGISDIGLYFEGTDYILTSSYKYSLSDFKRIFAKNEENTIELERFFKTREKVNFYSSFDTETHGASRLIIGYPVIWNEKYRAMLFYILKNDSVKSGFLSPVNLEKAALYIYDESGNLFFTNSIEEEKGIDFFKLENINAVVKSKKSSTELPYMIFISENRIFGKAFVSLFLKEDIGKEVERFYKNQNIALVVNLLGFLILFAITVYINYKPIFNLANKFKDKVKVKDESEIHTIISALDEMELAACEQKAIIREHIFNNILRGIKLSELDKKQVADFIKGRVFMVYIFTDLRLDSQKRTDLIETAYNTYDSVLSIVDDLQNNFIVIMCSAEREDAFVSLGRFLREEFSLKSNMAKGKAVEIYEDINKDYLYAISTLDNNTNIQTASDYPELDVFFRYLRNADEENALHALKEATCRIYEVSDSISNQKYICYDIATMYIKCIMQLQCGPGIYEMNELLIKEDINELHKVMEVSVKKVCAQIALSVEKSYISLQNNIVEYIEENLCDPGLCRNQIADRFGISIYSLSRMFKEKTGFGVKEYINDRRLEKAKHLILVTERSVADISESVGFTNTYYFPKLFRAKFGSSPVQYRNDNISLRENNK